jgi:hypothetical protein
LDKKVCKDCLEIFPLNNEYFYKNKSSSDGFNPYCKECTKKRSRKWAVNNQQQKKESQAEWYQDNRMRLLDKQKTLDTKNKDVKKTYLSNWQKENKDRVREYQIERNIHKTHNISDEELNELYEYANDSCMYCGLTEQESLELYNQRLHKDHAYNNGSDRIDNCVLACKSCNGSKRTKDWDEWYIQDNPKYTYDRYLKIEEWLNKFITN